MGRKSLFVGLLLIFFSITSLMATKNAHGEELKIGAYLALSGAGAPWGIASQRGIEMARDDLNAKGGITVGKTRYTIKTIAYDHKYTSEGGLDAVNRLIFEDKVKFIGMTFGTGPNLAGLSVSEPNKVLHITIASGAGLLGPDKPFSFRTLMGAPEYMPGLFRWLRKKYPEAKTVALLERDDAWGRDVSKFGRKTIEAQGMKVVYDDFFKIGTSDFSPWLTKVIASKADILENTGTAVGEGSAIIKLARQLGYKGIIATSVIAPAETILKIATPEFAEGAISVLSIVWEPDDPNLTPKQREFAKKYVEKFKEPMPSLAPLGYDNIMMLTTAMKKANSLDPAVVRDVIPTLEYDLLQGKARFGGQESYGIRRQIIMPMPIIQCVGGKFRFVGAEMP